jgi:solute carrier family 8 (sodium/calcium exchanger)
VKKAENTEMKVGVRTSEGTAKYERDFDKVDQVLTMKTSESEATIEVRIHDDDEWNPDNDFFLELYDVNTNRRLNGDDTQCKVTILDEDIPGKLQFKRTDIMGSRKNKKVDVIVNRIDGTSGHVTCNIRTEALIAGH